MKRFLGNWGVLATAWLAVIAIMAATVGLALLQAPPPPRGEPVTVTLLPPEPAEETLTADTEDAEGGEAETSEAVPLPAAPPTADPGQPGDAAAATGGDASAQPAETPDAGAIPEIPSDTPPETAPEPTPETAGKAADETAEAPEADAGDTAPLQAPAPAEQAAQEQTAAIPPPPAEPDRPASGAPATPEAAAPTPETPAAEAPQAPAEEQMVNIPAVPPAPEQLLYWERYRQPFNMDDTRPRIAVVLSGLGLSDSATEAAINQLPPAVTLSFSPYARNLERWIALARARGHEVMLDLPMEPATFPNEDPGPQGLLTTLSAEENLDRLDWVLSRGSAYVGVAGAMGSRFTASRTAIEPVLQAVKDRGLIFLDRRTSEHSLVPELADEIGLPSAINNRSVDERQASRVAIDARLAQVERIALTDGYAVAMAQPYPVTLDRLAEWATELGTRGLVIAPISAVADLQKAP
ncbi:divergent polysaccharide deacetylase family protein [Pelagibius sp. 7325]|uniref:divergent polysaccharide deacetylase family protein n=1 Tax=Pelagibius sp. 7325 TaxID=3131994 RepID=UPI0030EB83ED